MTYQLQHEKQQQHPHPLYHHHHRHLSDTPGSEQQQVRQETTTTTISSTTTTTSSSIPFASDSEPSMYNSPLNRQTHRSTGATTTSSKSLRSSHQQQQQQQDQQQQQQQQYSAQERYLGSSTESVNGMTTPEMKSGGGKFASNGHLPASQSRTKTHSTSSASSSSSSASSTTGGDGNGSHRHQSSERQRAAAEAHDHSGGIHSWPILFAIIPPLGALVFGKSDIWSDMLTLALIAFFLYNIIKVPWELYYAARTRRVLLSSVATNIGAQDPVLEMRRQAAAASLRRQEFFSLLLVLASPFLGGYTLQYLKTFFSSYEDYLSALNIELFIIASAIRPLTHLVSLFKARALHLQEEVHYPSTEVELLRRRVATIEAELNQLRRAVATKREVLQVQDSFEPTLHQLTKQIKRQDKREVLLRSYTEERFAQVEEKLREYDTILAYRLTEEQQHRASLLFLPINILVAMLGYFTYFLPARLTNAVQNKPQPAMLANAPAPQAIGDGRAIPENGRDHERERERDSNGMRGAGGGTTTTVTSNTTTTAHLLHSGRVPAHMSHRAPYEPLREVTRVY
ncbi:hypothetical protein BGW42_003756 [Actinomortierella wolfii]|nr:hypothetical protein BGW42_003756 [Actinomortierella wolfii]